MADGVYVGRHNAEALDQIVRQWEANGRRLDSARAAPTSTSASAPIVQAIEVTSGTADSDGYPSRILTFDATNWNRTYSECRAVKIGGGTLTTGFYPPGRLMRVADSGLHVYGVHPGAAASGGTELKGLTFTSDTGSTADSDPGNGLFKWNNATQASATVLYFDDLTADGKDLQTFFASLGMAGFIYLQQSDDSTKWQKWKWTTFSTDASGYTKFTVTAQATSVETIADAKTVYALFIPISTMSGARVGLDASDNFGASGTPEAIPFDTEHFDTNSYHDNVTNNTRLTVPKVGYYLVGCSLGVNDAGDPSGITVAIRLNGSVNIVRSIVGPPVMGDNRNHVCLVTPYQCTAITDYFEVTVVTADAAGVAVDATDDSEPVFWIKWLGP